jgi:molecular chaperone GrpE
MRFSIRRHRKAVADQVEEMKKDVEETMEEKDMELNTEETSDEALNDTEETAEAGSDEEKDEKAEEKEKKFGKKKRSARELELALTKSEEQVKDLTDKYQRLMAEFENARKRTAKETTRMYDMGAKDILEKLLPVVDNFERGMQTLSEEEKELPFIQGIDKIYKQFLTLLTDCHVEPMDAAGKEFNPDYHNAVMHVEDEELGDNVVAEELQKGYMYKDMVLRHSMVKVAN